jgi:hypothetical protein
MQSLQFYYAPMVIDDQVVKTYDLTHENTSTPIWIGVL